MRRAIGWALRAWDRFFFSRFDPYSLALVRVSLGVLWLMVLLFMIPNWARFFAADGLPSAVDPALTSRQDPWSVFAWTDGWLNVWAWWVFGVVTAALWIVGLCTRTMTVAVWVLISSMVHRDLMLINGEDVVLHAMLWLALFMPLGHELSVDEWLRQRRLKKQGFADTRPLPMIWATRLMQLMIVSVYAFSLPRKLTSDVAWWNGDAFFFAVINHHWSRWPWKGLFFHHWLSATMTYGTIAAEGLFPIAVWFRRTRVAAVVVMTVFHVLIAVMLCNVAFFSLSMAATFWAFVPGQTSRRWVAILAIRRNVLWPTLRRTRKSRSSANATDLLVAD